MTDRIPEALRNRTANRTANSDKQAPSRPTKTAPPTAGRILAAAASVASGIGLVGLLSSTTGQNEVVVQVAPTPVVIEQVITPASATPAASQSEATEQFIVVQPAEPVATVIQLQPAQAPVQQEPVAESKGS